LCRVVRASLLTAHKVWAHSSGVARLLGDSLRDDVAKVGINHEIIQESPKRKGNIVLSRSKIFLFSLPPPVPVSDTPQPQPSDKPLSLRVPGQKLGRPSFQHECVQVIWGSGYLIVPIHPLRRSMTHRAAPNQHHLLLRSERSKRPASKAAVDKPSGVGAQRWGIYGLWAEISQ
jgi:hypothetical protein